MRIRFRHLALYVLISVGSAYGQQSLFQSTDGQTAIFLNGTQNGVLLFNLATSKALVGYRHEVSGSGWGFGGDLTAVAQGGIASLLKNGVPQTGVGADISLNKQSLFWKAPPPPQAGSGGLLPCTFCSDWIAIQLGYENSQISTIANLTPPLQPPQTHNFNATNGLLAYDSLWKSTAGILKGDYLLGVSVGFSGTNNTATPTTLKTVQVSTQVSTQQGGQSLTVSQNSKTAYVGQYVKYLAAPVDVDAIWYPNRLRGYLGVDLFERSNVGQTPRYISPGLGVFVTLDKNGRPNPERPIGGVTASYQNKKAQVSIVTGWTF